MTRFVLDDPYAAFSSWKRLVRSSLTYIEFQWYKEIEGSAPGVPIVLVGTKSDLRNVKSAVEQLKKNGEEPITRQQGEEMAQEIGAYRYFECSAKTQDGLSQVFEESVRYVKQRNLQSS